MSVDTRNTSNLGLTQTKRGRGRPPKIKSEAVLTRRLQLMMSNQDMNTIETIRLATGATSMGQVVRQALANEVVRLQTSKKL